MVAARAHRGCPEPWHGAVDPASPGERSGAEPLSEAGGWPQQWGACTAPPLPRGVVTSDVSKHRFLFFFPPSCFKNKQKKGIS